MSADAKTSDTPSNPCPSPQRLVGWLDGRFELTEVEKLHLKECTDCQTWLERRTDAPELRSQVTATVTTTLTLDDSSQNRGFSAEPEFKALIDRIADSQTIHKGVSGTCFDADVTPGAYSLPMTIKKLQQMLPARYVVDRPLASGGAADVFLAFDRNLRLNVAIKVPLRDSLREQQRFIREARVLAELLHPNIVRVFDVGTLRDIENNHAEPQPAENSEQHGVGTPYIVMEYVAGGTIHGLYATSQDRDFRRIGKLFQDAASGLAAAHSAGLIHRDVKPHNLLYDDSQQSCKVADFGLARFVDADSTQITRTGEIVGTPAYMSPEQIGMPNASQGKSRLTAATDIYSLGASLYYVLTGRAPFQGCIASILKLITDSEPVSPRMLNPDIPLALEVICTKAMEKSPEARYATMQEFADDIGRYLSGQPTLARPISTIEQLMRWAHRNRSLAASLMIIVCLLTTLAIGSAIAAGVFWNQKREIVEQQQQNLRELCNQVAVADPQSLPLVFGQLKDYRSSIVPELEALWAKESEARRRLNVACALNILSIDRADYIVSQIRDCQTTPAQCASICLALAQDKARSLGLIAAEYKASEDSTRVKLGIIALQLGKSQLVEELVSTHPDLRTRFIHTLQNWYGEKSTLIKTLARQPSPAATQALALGIGMIAYEEFSLDELEEVRAAINTVRQSNDATLRPDTGIQSSLIWLERRLALSRNNNLEASTKQNAKLAADEAELDASSMESLAADVRGFRMLLVPAGRFTMGGDEKVIGYDNRPPHPVILTRDFWLADREVSVALFRAFAHARSTDKSSAKWSCEPTISPTGAHPAQQVSWYEAAEFCNWLSQLHGFEPFYIFHQASKSDSSADTEKVPLIKVTMNQSNSGYRLPTEAEFEYACRAGTTTLYSFGDSVEYFASDVRWSNNTRIEAAPCGTLLPNPWGFFEMHGNVWEWTQDWQHDFVRGQERIDPVCEDESEFGRVFRGGGVSTYTGYPESSSRGGASPLSRFWNVGFRVARTALSTDR